MNEFQAFNEIWCGSYECTTCEMIAKRLGINLNTRLEYTVEHHNLDDIWIESIAYINSL